MKGRAIRWSEAELKWVYEHREMARKEAYLAFCEKFGRTDISLSAYASLCKRKGWLTGRTGRYEKGSTPANKGKKMPYNPNSARTQFKKGHQGGKAQELYKPIGTERLTRDGYIERKIHDGLPLQSRWRAVHLLNWEAINGPVPNGYCLKCLDGNKQNTDPDNWKCISRAMLPKLAGKWSVGYDDAPEELKPAIMASAEIEQAIRDLKETPKK